MQYLEARSLEPVEQRVLDRKYRGMLSGGTRVEFKWNEFSR